MTQTERCKVGDHFFSLVSCFIILIILYVFRAICISHISPLTSDICRYVASVNDL